MTNFSVFNKKKRSFFKEKYFPQNKRDFGMKIDGKENKVDMAIVLGEQQPIFYYKLMHQNSTHKFRSCFFFFFGVEYYCYWCLCQKLNIITMFLEAIIIAMKRKHFTIKQMIFTKGRYQIKLLYLGTCKNK